jgi:hypothetical protein
MATTEIRGLSRRGPTPAATAARPAAKREREADGARKGRWPRRRREAETTAAGRRVAGAAEALTGASVAIETVASLCVSLLCSRRELALTCGGGEGFMRGSSCGR